MAEKYDLDLFVIGAGSPADQVFPHQRSVYPAGTASIVILCSMLAKSRRVR